MRSLQLLGAALAATGSLFAQAPANDDCGGAIQVYSGYNGFFSNVGATDSPEPFPCGGTTHADVWFFWVADCTNPTVAICGSMMDSKMEILEGSCGALTSVACVDDACELAPEINFTAVPGTTYYIRVGGFDSAVGSFPLNISCNSGIDMVAGVNGAALSTNDRSVAFGDNDRISWNYADGGGLFAGEFAATVLNVGNAGFAPTGFTPLIPGFTQLWSGSNPTGTETIYGPFLVGIGDQSVSIPTGIFGTGDSFRIQGLVLNAGAALGSLPVVATDNSVTFNYAPIGTGCALSEGFDGIAAPGVGVYAAGWSDGGGSDQWSSRSAPTGSNSTGPDVPRDGTVYMYCETSGTTVGDTFIMNSPTIPSAGLSTIEFALSRIGGGVGTLDVIIDDGAGGSAVTVASFTGNDPTNVEWSAESIALPAVLPANIRVQFLFTSGAAPNGSTFQGDLGIDAVCIR